LILDSYLYQKNMNQHLLAYYSDRLRKPEVIAQIQTIVRDVCRAAGVPPREILGQLQGTHRTRNARLRGEIGLKMKSAGFMVRDVCELFGQHKGTTLSQIQTAAARLKKPRTCGHDTPYGICKSCGKAHGYVVKDTAQA
jgi:hypothetical protein